MKKILLLVMCSLMLSGCATLNTQYKGSDQGYALMSFYIDNHNSAGDYQVKYTNELGEFAYFYYRKDGAWGKSDRDFDNENHNGRIELHELKAGKYTIVDFEMVQGARTFHYEDFAPYDFEISPNKTTYLGEIRGSFVRFKIRDEYERDLIVAKGKKPSINLGQKSLMRDEMFQLKRVSFIKVQ